MPKFYYKLVCTDSVRMKCKKYVSITSQKNLHCVTYEVGKWAKPSLFGSRLFVFDKRETAIDFMVKHDIQCSLFRCHVRNPKKLKRKLASNSLDFTAFWADTKYFIDHYICDCYHTPLLDMPKNTVCCDAVKLIKKV